MTVPKEGTATATTTTRAQIVKYLVEEQIVTQSAKELGVQVTDKEVSDAGRAAREGLRRREEGPGAAQAAGHDARPAQALDPQPDAVVPGRRGRHQEGDGQRRGDPGVLGRAQGRAAPSRRRRRPWPRPRRPSSRRCSRPSSSSSGRRGSPSAPRRSEWSTRPATTPPTLTASPSARRRRGLTRPVAASAAKAGARAAACTAGRPPSAAPPGGRLLTASLRTCFRSLHSGARRSRGTCPARRRSPCGRRPGTRSPAGRRCPCRRATCSRASVYMPLWSTSALSA